MKDHATAHVRKAKPSEAERSADEAVEQSKRRASARTEPDDVESPLVKFARVWPEKVESLER